MSISFTRSIPLLLLVFLVGLTNLAAQDKAAKIDEVAKRFNELGQFNGSVLVAENGRVIYKKGFGYANMEWKIPNDVDTKFRLGSVTKQFTATLILQLVEQGKIKLDGKITDYLTDYRRDTGDRVTIHQLLNHTSGIPSYTGEPGFFENVSRNPFTPSDFVKKHASGDLEFEPGSKFKYNNSGYFILGAIIEKVTGKSYAQAVRDNIFVPLAMNNSGFDTYDTVLPKRAAGYIKLADGYHNAPYLDMSLPYAAGSLYSTVEDLYLWDQALYGEKILSAKSKELMFKPGMESYGYGVGIQDRELSDKTKVPTISHNGGINGFNTELVRFVGDKHLIVVLDNTSQGRFQPKLISAIANILYGKSYESAKQPVSDLVIKTFLAKGIEAAIKQYRDLRSANSRDYDFSEEELNSVGYQLLRRNQAADAIEIFKLNVEMFPQSFNPYDSLGEAYLAAGEKELAIKNYKRSVELNPNNTNAAAVIKRLESPVVAVDAKGLDRFVGQYQVAPTFVITVTKEGDKLYGQATGQQRFELETISETKFAIRIVEAEIDFNIDEKGAVTGLTLHQGGRDITAKRLP